jgi:hypothetical protein
MPVATKARLLELNARSSEIRSNRRRQREELRSVTPEQFVSTIVDPPHELATFTLHSLLRVKGRRRSGAVPGFGEKRFTRLLHKLQANGQWWARPDVRLGALTKQQRRALTEAVLELAPRPWLEAA